MMRTVLTLFAIIAVLGLVCMPAVVYAQARADLIVVGTTTSATGTNLTGIVDNPMSLGQYGIAVSNMLTPNTSNPPSVLDDDALVGQFTPGTFTLNYEDLADRPFFVTFPVEIDNTTGQVYVLIENHMIPADSLQQVFMLLPAAPGPFPATLSVNLSFPVTLTITSVALAAAAGTTYVTDAGTEIVTLDNGRPGEANLTDAEIKSAVGATLFAKLTKVSGGDWTFDCHGWTFTMGVNGTTKWINNNQVKAILDDNGYKTRASQAAPNNAVQVGDVVVYTNPNFVKLDNPMGITHTGVVTKVAGGVATEVQSKWGGAGLYKHAPTDVPGGALGYGTPTVWFTTRGNNLLKTK